MAVTSPEDDKLQKLYEEWQDRAQELTDSWLFLYATSTLYWFWIFSSQNTCPPTAIHFHTKDEVVEEASERAYYKQVTCLHAVLLS